MVSRSARLRHKSLKFFVKKGLIVAILRQRFCRRFLFVVVAAQQGLFERIKGLN